VNDKLHAHLSGPTEHKAFRAFSRGCEGKSAVSIAEARQRLNSS
jgi:hypothetical protein